MARVRGNGRTLSTRGGRSRWSTPTIRTGYSAILYVETQVGRSLWRVRLHLYPDYWGHGYATEAAQAIVHYLFTDIGVSRVESSLHPSNAPSAPVPGGVRADLRGSHPPVFLGRRRMLGDMLYGVTRGRLGGMVQPYPTPARPCGTGA